MRKLLYLLTGLLIWGPVSFGQIATKAKNGLTRTTDSLNETRAGYVLIPAAGKALKALIDANTAAFANYAPKAGVTNDFSVGGNLTIPAVNGRYLGFTSFASGMTLSFKFGDDANSLANTWGGPMRLGGYHGIVIQNNASGSLPALRVNGVSSGQSITEFYDAASNLRASLSQAGEWQVAGGIRFADGTLQSTATAVATAPTPVSIAAISTKTFAAIQSAYDGAGDYVPTTINLSGQYLQGTTTLRLNNPKRFVTFVSDGTAELVGDPNTINTMVVIYSQSNGGWKNVKFSTLNAEQGFSWGMVLIAESGPVTDYYFDYCEATCPNLNANAFTIYPYSNPAANGSGVGTYHKNIWFRNLYAHDCGRMAIEWFNDDFSAGAKIKPRIDGARVIGCRFINLGLKSDHGYGNSFSGPNANCELSGCYFEQNRGYCNEWIGTLSGESKNNIMVRGKTVGGNMTAGHSFTDGGHSKFGAQNISVSNDYINLNGRPAQFYGSKNIRCSGQRWFGGLAIDINKGTQSDADNSKSIVLSSIDVVIAGDQSAQGDAGNALIARQCDGLTITDVNFKLAPTAGQAFSVINVASSCSLVFLSGGDWKRPSNGADSFYHMDATNSSPVGAHTETTF